MNSDTGLILSERQRYLIDSGLNFPLTGDDVINHDIQPEDFCFLIDYADFIDTVDELGKLYGW
jgi:hypothetical protein